MNFVTRIPPAPSQQRQVTRGIIILLSFLLSTPLQAFKVSTDFYTTFEPEPIAYEHALKQFKKLSANPHGPESSKDSPSPSNLRQKIANALGWETLIGTQGAYAVLYDEKLIKGGIRQSYFIRDPLIGTFETLVIRPLFTHAKTPAILALHGHGGSPAGFIQRDLVLQLLKKGFVLALPGFRAMEGLRERFNPGRITTEGRLVFYPAPRIKEPYERSVARELYKLNHPLMGLRVREASLSLSLLQSLPDLNPGRIALISHSGGSAVAELLLHLESNFAGAVLDYQSTYSRPWKSFCCENIPALSPIAAEIHRSASFTFPVLRVPYNFPDKGLILEFFQSLVTKEPANLTTPSIYAQTRQKIASWNPLEGKFKDSMESLLTLVAGLPYTSLRDSFYSDLLDKTLMAQLRNESLQLAMLHDFPRHRIQSLLKICLHQSNAAHPDDCTLPVEKLIGTLTKIQAGHVRQEAGVRSALVLISNDLGKHGLNVLKSLRPWNFDSLTSRTRKDLQRIFSLLLPYHSLEQARVLAEFLPPIDFATTWLPFAQGSAGSKFVPKALRELTRILKNSDIDSLTRNAFQCLLEAKPAKEDLNPCAEIGQEIENSSSLSPQLALMTARTMVGQKLPSEVQNLLNALNDPYDRVEFLLLLAFEILPPGPQRANCLSYLPAILKEHIAPSHRVRYLQLLINLLPASQCDEWFNLALISLKEIEDKKFQSSLAEPILNLALEYTNYSHALKFSELLGSEQERKFRQQKIHRKAQEKSRENPMRKTIQESLAILKHSTYSPASLQRHLDLEGAAAKAGLNTLRLTILGDLFQRWKEVSREKEVPEAFNLDFTERLLDTNLRGFANKVGKSLSLDGRLNMQVLGLAQVHHSIRFKMIVELLEALDTTESFSFRFQILEKILKHIEQDDFRPMRARFLNQAIESMRNLREDEFLEIVFLFAREIAKKGAVFEVLVILDKIEIFLSEHPNQLDQKVVAAIAALTSLAEEKSGIPMRRRSQ